MRSFALGVIVGTVACLAIIRVTGSQSGRQGNVVAAASDSPVAGDVGMRQPAMLSTPDEVSSAEPARVGTESLTIRRASNAPERMVEESEAPSGTGITRLAIENLNEKEAFDVCRRASELRERRKQAAKDAEPKDPGWAYAMEQLIRQHIESQVPADHFTKLQIECRSTFCDLRMEGIKGDDRELVQKLAMDIQRQPWSDIALKGSGGGSNGDEWHLDYEWYRPKTESERRAALEAMDIAASRPDSATQ